MALNEQMQEAIQEDIADTRSKRERIDEQMGALKGAGKFAGETAVESIPGVSEGIAVRNVSRDLKEGDYTGAGIEALAGLAGLAPAGGDALAKAIRTFKPKKTVKAYKLFTKGEDGNLYPLFVDADTPIKRGEYIQAVIPDSVFTAPNGKKYVPSKGTGKKKGTGDNIPIPDQATRDLLIEKGFLKAGSKAKSVKAVALRPGWHAGDSPAAPHIGNEYKGKKFRGEDQVWAEVEMPADVDWQTIANSRASIVKSGKRKGEINVKEAEITDQLPDSGFYRYKTNPNMQGNWLISGQMKVNRVLNADEVKKLNKEAGTEDLPTLNELKAKDMAKGGTVMDDYQFAELKMDKQQKFAKGGMSKQMELFEPVEGAFDEGGLMEEGGSVDPVSGNKVPVGSTQEEVRDDIPAQLSEGEFVFPADVVRYWGLETLMKMRQEAKAGLKLMDKMGQMGNSEEATIPDDIPFDINDLDMEDDGVLEYAQGGVVQAQQGTYVPPFIPTPDNQYGIAGYQTSQFAPRLIDQPVYGGPVPMPQPPIDAPMPPIQPPTTPPATTPTPVYQVPTFTGLTGIAQPEPGGYDEMRTYVNDAGMEMQIPFKNGSPIYPIPEGYKLKGEAVETAKTTTTTTGASQGPVQQESDDGPRDPFEGKNTINLGGTVITKENVETEGKTDISSFKPGQVKGTTKYATGTASSKTRPTSGIVSGIKDTVTGLTNQDQRTLTNKDGVTVAMSQELYDEIIGDRFGSDRQTMIDNLFAAQEKVEEQLGDSYSKAVDNQMAENLAKDLGIEYTGQSTAEIMTQADSAAQKAVENALKAGAEPGPTIKERMEQQAKEKGEEKKTEREAAAELASKFGISATNNDGTKKSASQLKNETAQAQQAARDAYREQFRQEQASGSPGQNDSGGPDVGSIGTGGSLGGGYGGGMEDYGGIFNKGGLAQQMKQSGLASKK